MKQHWIWLLVSWLMTAGLVGCAQTTTSFVIETATAEPVDTPQVEVSATSESMETPVIQPTVIPTTSTQVVEEENVMADRANATQFSSDLEVPVRQAKEDLAGRLGIDVDRIKVLEVREITWPDSSLGCPEEGVAYQQDPQPGLLIRLRGGNQMYFYHSQGDRPPFLCKNPPLVPLATPKLDEFVPPPDFEID